MIAYSSLDLCVRTCSEFTLSTLQRHCQAPPMVADEALNCSSERMLSLITDRSCQRLVNP
jgi:hypothetical protein